MKKVKGEVIYEQPFLEYLGIPAVSKSLLDVFVKCPADAKRMMDGGGGKQETKAMLTGKIVEDMVQSVSIFDPASFEKVAAVHPEKYTTADGESKPWNWNANHCKDWRKELPEGQIVMSPKERDNALRLGEAIRSNKVVQELIADGKSQVTLKAVHRFGLPIKGRPDWFTPNYMVDLKTTFDASTEAFSRSIADRRYHVQAAMYMTLAELCGYHPTEFYFIVAQTGDTPKINVRYLKQSAIDVGRFTLDADLDAYQKCLASGFWPDYMGAATGFDSIEAIDIPKWAYSQFPVTLTGAIEV